jgi:hypothetical protein
MVKLYMNTAENIKQIIACWEMQESLPYSQQNKIIVHGWEQTGA